MDMMRPMSLAVARSLSASPSLAATGVPGAPIDLRWTDSTPGDNPAMLGNPANEIGFRVERATVDSAGVESTYTVIGNALANVTSYEDTTTAADTAYRYRVIALNAAGEAVSNTVTLGPLMFFAEYTITPTAGMGGAISPSVAETVAAGADSSTFTVTPNAGFVLADVLVDGVSMGPVSTYQFTGVANDHTIWALFAPETYTDRADCRSAWRDLARHDADGGRRFRPHVHDHPGRGLSRRSAHRGRREGPELADVHVQQRRRRTTRSRSRSSRTPSPSRPPQARMDPSRPIPCSG